MKTLNVQEAAKYLKIAVQTLRDKVYKKSVPFHRLSPRKVIFYEEELELYIQGKGKDITPKDTEIKKRELDLIEQLAEIIGDDKKARYFISEAIEIGMEYAEN